jgi:hypothetical protein
VTVTYLQQIPKPEMMEVHLGPRPRLVSVDISDSYSSDVSMDDKLNLSGRFTSMMTLHNNLVGFTPLTPLSVVNDDEDEVLFTEDAELAFDMSDVDPGNFKSIFPQTFNNSDDSNIAIFLRKCERSLENPLLTGKNDPTQVVEELKT